MYKTEVQIYMNICWHYINENAEFCKVNSGKVNLKF